MEKHMFQVKEINKAPFEDAERVFETSHPELRYAVASQRAVGFYESLKDYNENASLWVAWFEGENPPISRHSSNRKSKRPRRRWKSNPILFEQV